MEERIENKTSEAFNLNKSLAKDFDNEREWIKQRIIEDKKPTASEVAKYIIYSFQEMGDYLANMKLQKLLYYVQGWHLANFGTPAFEDRLEAWALGPVQPEVYDDYKEFEFRPITRKTSDPDLKDCRLCDLIDDVLDTYGAETGYALHKMTHQESPWLNARGDISDEEPCNNEITKSSMLEFFKSVRAKSDFLQSLNKARKNEQIT